MKLRKRLCKKMLSEINKKGNKALGQKLSHHYITQCRHRCMNYQYTPNTAILFIILFVYVLVCVHVSTHKLLWTVWHYLPFEKSLVLNPFIFSNPFPFGSTDYMHIWYDGLKSSHIVTFHSHFKTHPETKTLGLLQRKKCLSFSVWERVSLHMLLPSLPASCQCSQAPVVSMEVICNVWGKPDYGWEMRLQSGHRHPPKLLSVTLFQ